MQASSAEPELPDEVSRTESHLSNTENAVNVLTAAPHAITTAGPASQPAEEAVNADADVELLFGDLLTAPAQPPAADAAAQNSTARIVSNKVTSGGAAAADVPNPAASDSQLADILDGLLDIQQPIHTAFAAAASTAAAEADVARGSAASALSEGATHRGALYQQSKQLQQQQYDPFAASAAVQPLSTAGSSVSVMISDTQQQQQQPQQQQQQLQAPSTAVGPRLGEAAIDSEAAAALTASALTSATASAAQSAAAAAAAVRGSDSDDEDSLDMLQDMAEVLQVQESVSAAGSAPAAVALPAPPLPPAAATVTAAHGASSSASGRSADQEANRSRTNSITQQQLQQHHGEVTRQSSAAFHTFLQPSASLTGQSLELTAPADDATEQLPAHEVALQQAWEYEQTLYHGGLVSSDSLEVPDSAQQQLAPKRRRLEPLPRLKTLLADARHDWNPAGRPDASGTAMVGGSVLLKLESLAGLFAGAAGMGPAGRSSSSSGGGSSGGGGGVDWSQVLAAALAPHGPLQV